MLRKYIKFFSYYFVGLVLLLLVIALMASPSFGAHIVAEKQNDGTWTAEYMPTELPKNTAVLGMDVSIVAYACEPFQIGAIKSTKVAELDRLGRCATAQSIPMTQLTSSNNRIFGTSTDVQVRFFSSKPFVLEVDFGLGPAVINATLLGLMIVVCYTGVMLFWGSSLGITWLKDHL